MCVEDTLIINTKKYKSKQEIFDTAGQLAVEHSKAMGLPITFVRNGNVIKKHSDGREEILGIAPKRVKIHKKVINLKK
ncbi:MAG: hypothetical protein B6241_15580 [Spirochaetaceae bacterium 4572_59]|nr:MAG: hypothetical protein B6241_15580 [Spirochaetaceae bacterium 4572_59]